MGNVLFALFKHKWKILLCTAAGILAALAVYFLYPPKYESHAKLLVRYVLERAPLDSADSKGNPSDVKAMLSVIGNEMVILTSWDLMQQVAEALGPKRLLPQANAASVTAAAGSVLSGLTVAPAGKSNIILVSYQNSDPELVRPVLEELVNRYFTRHLEVHRSVGAFNFVTQQTDQVRARLNETEDALRALKAKAGIVSLADSSAALSANLAKAEEQLYSAEDELAERRAQVKHLEEKPASGEEKSAAPRPAASADVQQYKAVVQRLADLQKAVLELELKYTSENVLVRADRDQIKDLQKQKSALEEKFPELALTAEGPGAVPVTLASEKVRLSGLEAKTEKLRARLNSLKEGVKSLSDLTPKISELERSRDLEIANYKYFKETLEKARVDEALDPSKMPNISPVERPTNPSRVFGNRNKIALALAVGGLGLAIAFALAREMFLNHTVKLPNELENRLGSRLLLSIPYSRNGARKRLLWNRTAKESSNGQANSRSPAPWEIGHFIRPYSEAIRDRLGLYFELNRMTHKPKLVGVTGFAAGAGTSTLAVGLAAALSELGEGRVLLVDVNLGPGDGHPLFNGRPALPLTDALKADEPIPAAADNLYLATVGGRNSAGPAQLGLKKFFDLMPNLKASDFDYIIFDMPPLGQTSPTLGMAGFMDKVLLVVEGEKTGRETAKRGYEALVAGRDNVSVVFNKARSYTPEWLQSES